MRSEVDHILTWIFFSSTSMCYETEQQSKATWVKTPDVGDEGEIKKPSFHNSLIAVPFISVFLLSFISVKVKTNDLWII